MTDVGLPEKDAYAKSDLVAALSVSDWKLKKLLMTEGVTDEPQARRWGKRASTLNEARAAKDAYEATQKKHGWGLAKKRWYCHGSAYEIGLEIAKRIESGSAKRIRPGSAKWIGKGGLGDRAGGAGSAKRIRPGSAKRILLRRVFRHLQRLMPRGPVGPEEDAAMSARRTSMHRLQELVRLHRLGKNCRETARLLTMGPNTERRYRQALQAAGLLDGEPGQLPELRVLKLAVERFAPAKPAPQQASSIERWRDQIAELVDDGLGAQAVFDRLRLEQDDFKGSIGAVKRMVRRLGRERGVQPEDVAIPVETDPGDVAQVDFGYAGRLWDPDTGRVRKAWVFVMVLGYSRHLVARLVFDQRTETWLRLHVEAFAELGGVARTLVPDNLKAAVIRAAFGVDGPTALNRSYQELARHYGFTVDPTPPRAPKKKGKVEAGVKYVKRNFLRGRDGADISELRPQLDRWVNEIAGQRIHGTTGKRPLEVFEQEERTSLMPLPLARFEPVLWKQAKVHRDSHFIFERRLYSVPWRLIGQQIWVRATSSTVMAYADDERVATHPRSGRRYRSTIERHLPEQRAALRHRSRQYWEERADRMGPEVGRYIREVFDSDEVLSQLRTVQAIVTHLEGFPRHRAVAACRRARFFANYSYPGIRNILKRALDLEALPNERMAEVSWPTPPRFARDLRELAITGRGGQA